MKKIDNKRDLSSEYFDTLDYYKKEYELDQLSFGYKKKGTIQYKFIDFLFSPIIYRINVVLPLIHTITEKLYNSLELNEYTNTSNPFHKFYKCYDFTLSSIKNTDKKSFGFINVLLSMFNDNLRKMIKYVKNHLLAELNFILGNEHKDIHDEVLLIIEKQWQINKTAYVLLYKKVIENNNFYMVTTNVSVIDDINRCVLILSSIIKDKLTIYNQLFSLIDLDSIFLDYNNKENLSNKNINLLWENNVYDYYHEKDSKNINVIKNISSNLIKFSDLYENKLNIQNKITFESIAMLTIWLNRSQFTFNRLSPLTVAYGDFTVDYKIFNHLIFNKGFIDKLTNTPLNVRLEMNYIDFSSSPVSNPIKLNIRLDKDDEINNRLPYVYFRDLFSIDNNIQLSYMKKNENK